jgi:hypothetical protein
METAVLCRRDAERRMTGRGNGCAGMEGFEMPMLWIAALALLLVAPTTGMAQPYPVPDTWGGDLLSRPRLTGDWGGLRDEMGKKGIVLDVDVILTPQAVATGGVETGVKFWATPSTPSISTRRRPASGRAAFSRSSGPAGSATTSPGTPARSFRRTPSSSCPRSRRPVR